MAQTGYTPISIYYSSTVSNTPTAGNLVAGELAINTADGKLFYKDSSGVVQVLGTKGGVGSSTTTQVLYNSSGLVVGSANMTFDGSTLTTLNTAYTGTLTGGTGVVNLGSGQFYKDASGKVGIGTTNPLYLLQVGTGGAEFSIGGAPTTNGTGRLKFINTNSLKNWQISTNDNISGALEFTQSTASGGSTFTTPSMIINTSGNVGIGTVSPSYKFHAERSTTTDFVGYFKNGNSTSGDQCLGLRLENNANNTSSQYITCTANSVGGNGTAFIVYGNGNVVNVNNSYGALSDIKLKENIVDATPKLADLMQVKVRNYNLIGDTQKQIGVVAQELEQVFAGLVDETKDKDMEGNELGTTTKSVKYSVFVPMLVKAIQELKAEFDAYKATHP